MNKSTLFLAVGLCLALQIIFVLWTKMTVDARMADAINRIATLEKNQQSIVLGVNDYMKSVDGKFQKLSAPKP